MRGNVTTLNPCLPHEHISGVCALITTPPDWYSIFDFVFSYANRNYMGKKAEGLYFTHNMPNGYNLQVCAWHPCNKQPIILDPAGTLKIKTVSC